MCARVYAYSRTYVCVRARVWLVLPLFIFTLRSHKAMKHTGEFYCFTHSTEYTTTNIELKTSDGYYDCCLFWLLAAGKAGHWNFWPLAI